MRVPNFTQNQNYEQFKETNELIIKKIKAVKKRNTSAETFVVDSDVLLSAPKSYFDKYLIPTEVITNYIQTKMSETDGDAVLVNQLRQDPTRLDLRETAYQKIKNNFLIHDQNPIESIRKYYTLFNDLDKIILQALVFNEICGLGPLEPLFRDFRIKEIICNGPKDIQIEMNGRVRRVESCNFKNADHLQDLITRLYASINKSITRTNPMERARLHDNSRVFAVHESVAPTGPSLNIRRHTDEWTSPEDLIKYDSASVELMEWLGQHINEGLNFITSGATASGKTTLLAALTGFYRNDARLLTIERNIELKGAPNKLWGAAMEVVPANPGTLSSGVSMRQLVEASTQMRPDGIILGEITGEEAWDVTQALNSGHFGATTVHANSAKDTILRMVSLITQADMIKGEELLNQLASSFDLIIVTTRFPQDGSRKITGVYEIGLKAVRDEAGVLTLPIKPIWIYKADAYSKMKGARVSGEWVKVGDLSKERFKKHNLDLVKLKNWDELSSLYKEGEK